MSTFFRALLLTVVVLLLGSTVLAQDAQPSGKILVWMQVANQDQMEATVLPAFYEAYPGIEIEFVNYSPVEVANQLALAIQGGTGAPDVALMETAQIARIVDLGGVLDLTDRLAADLSDLAPSSLELGKKDDAYYAVPWDVGPVVLYYRRDIFEAAGLPTDPEAVDEMVSTWDKFLEVCQTIKNETGLYCFANNKANNYGDVWSNMLWSQGIGWYNADGQVTVNSPEAVAALEKLGEFWAADLLSDDLEWTDNWYATLNTVALDDLNIKPVATLPIAAWMGGFLKNWAAPDTTGLWGVVRFPAMTEGGVRSANQGGSSYVIPEQSQNVEAAWAFISFVNSAESQIALFDYGDIFPARLSTYEDPIFEVADPYFADQPVREVYADAGAIIPVAPIYGVYYPVMNSATDTAIQKFATGQLSAADALAEAASIIRSETGLQ
jgi:ABC-type glycerol-3-phosphate transport system substrate-binding protein